VVSEYPIKAKQSEVRKLDKLETNANTTTKHTRQN